MMSLAATQERGPTGEALLSYQTAREKIMKLPDAFAEADKVLAEKGKRHPVLIAARIAAAMVRRGDTENAELMLNWIASQGGQAAPGEVVEAGGGMGGGGGAGGGGGGMPATPPNGTDPLRPIIDALVQAGRSDVAEAVLQTLGVTTPAPVG